jgi:potassium-transporting ATPase potassium-binding subunit
MALLNMLFGEVVPGGVGTGLYGLPVVAVIAVFLAGLMVGRTPEEAGNMVDLDSSPTKLIDVMQIGKQLLITRGALTAFPSPTTWRSTSRSFP